MTLLSGEDCTVVMITVEPFREETVMVKLPTELSVEESHSISPVMSLVPWEMTLYCTPDGPGGGANANKVKNILLPARNIVVRLTDLVAGE